MAPYCWQCGRKLEKRDGALIFDLYTDPIGNKHAVHKICGSNLKGAPTITAQEGDQLERMDEYHDRLEDARAQ